jgi:hypothetical protein
MYDSMMSSLLHNQEKEEHALSSIFPIGMLQSPELVTEDTIEVKLKYSFTMEIDQLTKDLIPLFEEDGEEEIFTEEFRDVENYDLMRASVWAKLITPIGRKSHSISLKYVEPKKVDYDNYIIYNEYKIHPSDTVSAQYHLASMLLMTMPVKISLQVHRQRYKLKKNGKIKLTWDKVRFVETKDEYSVFAIFADVPKGQLDKLVGALPQEETMKIITNNALPSRSKIIELLYRHKKWVYNSLVDSGLVDVPIKTLKLVTSHFPVLERRTGESAYSFLSRCAKNNREKIRAVLCAGDPLSDETEQLNKYDPSVWDGMFDPRKEQDFSVRTSGAEK